ncbi:MAG: HTH-type transcriptional regulator BenM [Candidatus Celerinatantimonas neptuna]|nr:MAG: HTH-type transcriptional regulator BenM [Candidatus Celerinatantimonas neptuna]
MEFRQLRYFLAVAECMHFTKAAEQLRIAQPPLSLQIQKLEREIGTPLFIRHPRSIELTEAGIFFKERAQKILEDSEQTLIEIKQIARGHCGQLSIGFAGSVAFNPLIPKIIREYRKMYENIRISSQESDSLKLVEKVYQCEIDCAFVRMPLDCKELITHPVVEEELVAVLPSTHPLHDHQNIPLVSLANTPFIMFPRAIGPMLYDFIIEECRNTDFEPNVEMESPQISSIANLVAAGFGISLIPESMKHIQLPGVQYHHLIDSTARSIIAFIHRPHERSAVVKNLINLLTHLSTT